MKYKINTSFVRFGEILKEFRLFHKLTHRGLSEKLGMTHGVIGLIERGERFPEYKVWEKFLYYCKADHLIECYQLHKKLIEFLNDFTNYELMKAIYFLERQKLCNELEKQRKYKRYKYMYRKRAIKIRKKAKSRRRLKKGEK